MLLLVDCYYLHIVDGEDRAVVGKVVVAGVVVEREGGLEIVTVHSVINKVHNHAAVTAHEDTVTPCGDSHLWRSVVDVCVWIIFISRIEIKISLCKILDNLLTIRIFPDFLQLIMLFEPLIIFSRN